MTDNVCSFRKGIGGGTSPGPMCSLSYSLVLLHSEAIHATDRQRSDAKIPSRKHEAREGRKPPALANYRGVAQSRLRCGDAVWTVAPCWLGSQDASDARPLDLGAWMGAENRSL